MKQLGKDRKTQGALFQWDRWVVGRQGTLAVVVSAPEILRPGLAYSTVKAVAVACHYERGKLSLGELGEPPLLSTNAAHHFNCDVSSRHKTAAPVDTLQAELNRLDIARHNTKS